MIPRSIAFVALACALALAGCAIGPAKASSAPDFSLQVLDGGSFTLSQHRGEVVLVDFMAMSCGPCKKQFQDFAAVKAQYGRRDFTIVSIDVDPSEGNATLARFAKSLNATWPIGFDTSGIGQSYGVLTIPHQVLVDRSGRIAFATAAGEILTRDKLTSEVEKIV